MTDSNITPKGEEVKGGDVPPQGAGASRPDARARTAPAGFRRLEVGEEIQEHDVVWPVRKDDLQETICAGSSVEYDDLGYYYRRLPVDATCDCEGPNEANRFEGYRCPIHNALSRATAAPAAPEPASGEGSKDELIRDLVAAIEKAQEQLGRYIVPNSGLTEKRLIDNLLAILDDRKLVETMRTARAERGA